MLRRPCQESMRQDLNLRSPLPLRSSNSKVHRTLWTLCVPNAVFYVSTKKPEHLNFFKCSGALPRVDATRFELATSASRTQRSTKLSHASIFIFSFVAPPRYLTYITGKGVVCQHLFLTFFIFLFSTDFIFHSMH